MNFLIYTHVNINSIINIIMSYSTDNKHSLQSESEINIITQPTKMSYSTDISENSLQSENFIEITTTPYDVVNLPDDSDNIDILYEISKVDETPLTEQFVCNDKKLSKIYANKRLNPTQLATVYATIANGIIDVSKHINQASNNSVEAMASPAVKISAKGLKIIQDNKKAVHEKQMNDIVARMRIDADEIINSDLPTVPTLESKVHYYTTSMPNKIIKAIILRSLLTRYMNSSAESLIPFIFEFKNELLAFRSEWIIEGETNTEQSSATDGNGKVTHRKARMQKKAVSASVVHQLRPEYGAK